MKIKFLGTAAAEGWPALFCECKPCSDARIMGGKNIRTRSSCLINDIYLVDFPPDTYAHVLSNKLSLNMIQHLIITHSHEDHFYPEDIHMRKEPYAHIFSHIPLTIYGNSHVKKRCENTDNEEEHSKRLAFKEVYPYQKFQAGDAAIIPLLADHKKGEQCYIYLISINGKTLFYGHDSGYFPENTWDILKNISIDAVILDCTDGPGRCINYHMGFPTVLKVKERLSKQECAHDNTIFIITHFSHNGGYLHEELLNMALPYGFITAYDGMEIEI